MEEKHKMDMYIYYHQLIVTVEQVLHHGIILDQVKKIWLFHKYSTIQVAIMKELTSSTSSLLILKIHSHVIKILLAFWLLAHMLFTCHKLTFILPQPDTLQMVKSQLFIKFLFQGAESFHVLTERSKELSTTNFQWMNLTES